MAAHGSSPRPQGPTSTSEIVGVGLADVVQIQHQNRFSGCIAVESAQGRGHLFLREGEIIHAEMGGRSGEEVFQDLLDWQGSRFVLQPNVATTRTSIQKTSAHLLLDAHRVLDERRAGRREPPPIPRDAPGAPARPPVRAAEILERVRRVPGVTHAALHSKDGTSTEDSYQAETLAGQALYLAMVGNQAGTVFKTGPLLSAVVHGSRQHFLLLSAKSHFLSVLIAADTPPGAVEAEVRRVLAAR